MGLGTRLAHAWNAFMNRDPTKYTGYHVGYSSRPDRIQMHYGNEKSLTAPIYNRMAMDVAALRFEHAQFDELGRYLEPRKSSLNECLTLNANTDQTSRSFIQDLVLTILDEGCAAIVPVKGDRDPFDGSFDPDCLRIGKILEWFPSQIRVEVYNEDEGKKQELIVDKSYTPIIENPFYVVMNQTNSTLRRLVRKLNLMDTIDEMSASGKLDLIIQLPFSIRNEGKRQIANDRLKDIENQLANGKMGIAYIDQAEKVTQLNRALENKIFQQIDYYTKMFYGQLGFSDEVFNGTASEEQMLNYYNRSTEPLASAICDAMKWKFLTKTARTQGQTITFFRDVFKLVPVNQIADIADKFTRNEILSSNEVRGIIGFKPSKQEGADDLRNKNINQSKNQEDAPDKAATAGELIKTKE